MSPLRKIIIKPRQRPPDRELFSVNLPTATGRGGDDQITAMVVRELLALTLAGNRELAKILQAYRKKLGFDTRFPKDLYDQWVSRRVHGKDVPKEIADQKKRSERRQQIADLTRLECQGLEVQLAQGSGTVEHITLRIYAAEVLKPQSKGKPRYQLLAIAYHLKQQWVHVEMLDISQSYLARDTEKKRTDHARMLTRSQWQGLAQSLRNRAEAEGTGQDAMLVIHAPQGCELGDLLTISSVGTVEDMPPIPAETIELTYRIKDSKRYRPKQESFAAILRKPTQDELLTDLGMSALPNLTNLTHQQKDVLIHTLWKRISILSQPEGSAEPSESPG